MNRSTLSWTALAALLVLAPACGGRLTTGTTAEQPAADASDELHETAVSPPDAAAPSLDDAAIPVPSVPDASPYPVACGTPCPASTYSVSWLSPDGGLDLCECVPLVDGRCMPIDSTTSDCSCTICGSETTLGCTYDPYYGNVTTVTCKAP